MEFRLLGPVEVEGERSAVPLGSGKQRALVAILLLHANELVSRERLIDELWGDDPPASAAHSVEVYVSRLRKALHDAGADGVLVTRGSGYVLAVDDGRVDFKRFERLLDAARAAEPEHASPLLREALALWRGRPLADVELPGPARLEVDRLEELRLAALEERIESDLALGRHAQVVAELQALVGEHPLRERLRAQLMRALYGGGRQADALETYADARRALDELGLEPSEQLGELQRRILVHDPSLAAAPILVPGKRPRRQRAIALVAVVLVAASAAALAIALTRGSGAEAALAAPNSVGLFDPAVNRLVADIPIGGSPSNGFPNIAVGLGSVWVCNLTDRTLVRIDERTRTLARTIGLGATPGAIAVGHGAVWVVTAPATALIELDSLGNIVRRVRLPPRQAPTALPERGRGIAIAIGPDAVWVVHGLASVAKVDPRTGVVLHDTTNLGGLTAGGIVATRDALWVTAPSYGAVVQLDPATGAVVAQSPQAGGSNAVWHEPAAGAGGIWVTDPLEGLVWRVNPTTVRPGGSVRVDTGPIGIAIRGGSVWVAGFLAGTIDRIDPQALQVTSQTKVGPNPSDLAASPEGLWIAFGAGPPA